MSFRDLKQAFEAIPDLKKLDQDQFRFLYLRCLFEINGNLDTLALSSRAIVEILDRQLQEKQFDRQLKEKQFDQALAMVEELKQSLSVKSAAAFDCTCKIGLLPCPLHGWPGPPAKVSTKKNAAQKPRTTKKK